MDEAARPSPGPEPAEPEPADATLVFPAVPPIVPPPVPPAVSPPVPPAVSPTVSPTVPPPLPSAAPPAPLRTRRWVLAGGLAVLAGGGAGVGAAFLRRHRTHRPPAPPAVLVALAETERRLIADLDATTGGSAEVRVVIEQATANHRDHLSAIEGLLAQYRSAAAKASRSPGRPRTKAELRSAESAAAAAAAGWAVRQGPSLAGLLASISACESSHAELLS